METTKLSEKYTALKPVVKVVYKAPTPVVRNDTQKTTAQNSFKDIRLSIDQEILGELNKVVKSPH